MTARVLQPAVAGPTSFRPPSRCVRHGDVPDGKRGGPADPRSGRCRRPAARPSERDPERVHRCSTCCRAPCWRGGLHPLRTLGAVRDVIRERWTGRRVGYILVGLFSFYLTYVAYRNFKGFLPFLRPELHDTTLLELDRRPVLRPRPVDPAALAARHGVANSVLSVVYVVYPRLRADLARRRARVVRRHPPWPLVRDRAVPELGARCGQLLPDPVDGPGVRRAAAVSDLAPRRRRRCSTPCGPSG